MKAEDINWYKYDEKEIDFILNNSSKILEETVKSFREITNKCYVALGFYVSIISYCVNKVFTNDTSFFYLIPILGCAICLYYLWSTLLPSKLTFPGVLPQNLINDEFEGIGEHKMYSYKANMIVDYNNGAIQNINAVKKRIAMFKKSIQIFIGTLIFTFLFYICFVTECFK